LPADFTIHSIAALVRDVAVAMEDMPAVLKKHGLTQQQYDSLATNEFFQRVLEDAVQNWHKPQSTKERVALAAAIAIEDALPKIAARMSAARENLADVVETAKLFADLAGMGPKANQIAQPTGEKFSININLGNDRLHIETTRPLEGGVAAILPDSQRPGDAAALRPVIEGESAALPLANLTNRASEISAVQPLPQRDSADLPLFDPQEHIETGL
jgi:hypothetical protein